MDLHVVEPDGEEIFYGHMCNREGTACLDIDMLGTRNGRAAENIGWTTGQHGNYKAYVVNYNGNCPAHDYNVFIKLDDETTGYTFTAPAGNNAKLLIMDIDYPNI